MIPKPTCLELDGNICNWFGIGEKEITYKNGPIKECNQTYLLQTARSMHLALCMVVECKFVLPHLI